MDPSQGPVPAVPVEARIDDVVLPGRLWLADFHHASIALVHGLGEHSGRYASLASSLAAAGYSVAALDWPGHGEAKGRRGDVRSWTALRDRMIDASFEAIPRSSARPRIVFGHSMGGLMALDYALAHPRGLSGVAVSAPAILSAAPPRWKLALARLARAVAPGLGFSAEIEVGRLSRDPEVVRARGDDKRVHDTISPRLYFDLLDARERVMRRAPGLALPALVLQGTADSVVDPEGARRFCEAATGRPVTCRFYEGAYHEIFNDLGRERCVTDLLSWLLSVAPR